MRNLSESRGNSLDDEEVQINTPFNFKNLKNDEQIITNKISYEWKNIYRQLIADAQGGEIVDIKTFDAACLKFQVNFTREELRKIKNLFTVSDINTM